MSERSVGSNVYLRCHTGYGGLNYMFLWDHEIHNDTPVEIVGKGNGRYRYQVKLPDGYLLDVDDRDVSDKPITE